ncbi:MAG: MerR family transcriptional regulator [Deferrisomatales bacterium]
MYRETRTPETGDESGRLYSIKEASELTDVPTHTLRFWERKIPGFLKPVRTTGGQRRYTEECLQKVRKLDYYVNHKGMSLVGAQRLIEEGLEPEDAERRELAERILSDKRVRQAIDEIVELIRKKIMEEI